MPMFWSVPSAISQSQGLFLDVLKTPFLTSSLMCHLFQINGGFPEAYETTGLG